MDINFGKRKKMNFVGIYFRLMNGYNKSIFIRVIYNNKVHSVTVNKYFLEKTYLRE